jgi:hypothetical protein
MSWLSKQKKAKEGGQLASRLEGELLDKCGYLKK